MNQFHIQWYLKQEEKKKEVIQRNHVARINKNMNRKLIEILHKGFVEADYEKEIRYANRFLVNCSILDVKWANNYENPETFVLQYLFAKMILTQQDDDSSRYFLKQIESYYHEINRIKSLHYLVRKHASHFRQ